MQNKKDGIDYDRIRDDWIYYYKLKDSRFYKFFNVADNTNKFELNHKELFHNMFTPSNKEMSNDEWYDAMFGMWIAFVSVEYELLERSIPILNKLKKFMGDKNAMD